jgi:hypothetical protein
MEVIKKAQCVVIDDQPYRVEGYGKDMGDGSFQSVCNIVTSEGESTKTKRLAFQIFTKDQSLAAEVGLLCGTDIVSKEHARINNGI